MAAHPQIANQLGSDGEELVGALLESMVDAVYAVDDAGAVLFANPAAVRILGYDSESELVVTPESRDDRLPASGWSAVPGVRVPAAAAALDRRGRACGRGLVCPPRWTFVPVAYSSAPVKVGLRRGAVVVFRAVSERRRAEAERLRA